MKMTTLCYIENSGRTLMLHRTKKKNDQNAGKWIGVGGHIENGESPEDCLVREVMEETGLTLDTYTFRGIVTFVLGDETEYMCLYTAIASKDELIECSEGELCWIENGKLDSLPMWEGDRIFFSLIRRGEPFFSLKLSYDSSGRLEAAVLNGKNIPLHKDMADRT